MVVQSQVPYVHSETVVRLVRLSHSSPTRLRPINLNTISSPERFTRSWFHHTVYIVSCAAEESRSEQNLKQRHRDFVRLFARRARRPSCSGPCLCRLQMTSMAANTFARCVIAVLQVDAYICPDVRGLLIRRPVLTVRTRVPMLRQGLHQRSMPQMPNRVLHEPRWRL